MLPAFPRPLPRPCRPTYGVAPSLPVRVKSMGIHGTKLKRVQHVLYRR
jgi:hypothetical protein